MAIDRRDLIRRAAITGGVVWTAPVILESLSSPAAAATGPSCRLYVLEVTRSGNSGNCDASFISSDAGCATSVSGLDASTCATYARTATNDLGLECSYDDDAAELSFTVSLLIGGCAIVGVDQTDGSGDATPCDSSITLTPVGPTTSYPFTIPAPDVNNSTVWAYVAVQCD